MNRSMGWFIAANKNQHSVNVNGEITILSEEEIGNLIKKALSRSKVVRNLFDQFGVDLSKLNELEIIVVPLRKKFAETDGITMKINKDLLSIGNFLDNLYILVHEITHYLARNSSYEPEINGDDYFDDQEEILAMVVSCAYLIETGGNLEELYNKAIKRSE